MSWSKPDRRADGLYYKYLNYIILRITWAKVKVEVETQGLTMYKVNWL